MISTFNAFDDFQNRVTSVVRTARGHWYIEGGDGKLHEWKEPSCTIWANIMKTKNIKI